MITNGDQKGLVLRPTTDPHPVVFNPWYNLVVVSTGTTPEVAGKEVTLSSQALFTALTSQLGIATLDPNSGFAVKIQRAYVWCVPKGDFKSIDLGVAFFGLNRSATSTTSVLAPNRVWVEDFSSGSTPASVGYQWPLVDRQVVIYNFHDAKLDLAVIACNLPSMPLQYHWHVLWQSCNPAAVPRGSALSQRLTALRLSDAAGCSTD